MIPALLIVLAVLQALDGFATRRILDQGGRELNPVMRAGFAAIGLLPVGNGGRDLPGRRSHHGRLSNGYRHRQIGHGYHG